MTRRALAAHFALLLALAACASASEPPMREEPDLWQAPRTAVVVVTVSPPPPRSPPREQSAAERDPVFAKCAACHTLTPGISGIGPSLAGIYGRDSASLPGFRYSSSLSELGLRWDAQTLDRWLANPQAMAPDTKMLFSGLKNPLERAELIAFLQREAKLAE